MESPPQPTLAIQRQTKGDAIHPSAELFALAERGKLPVRVQECFLRNVLGVRAVPENAISDVKNAALIFTHTHAESGSAFFGIRSSDQIIHARPRLPKRTNCCKFKHRCSFPIR
jgi:hypothetical protein